MNHTQRLIQKLTRLIIETGILTGQEIVLFIFSMSNSDHFSTCTATIAIINLVLFLIPSTAAYFETTSAVLGKMYSNTMMAVLNSRMIYGIANDTTWNELSSAVTFRRSVFLTSQVAVSVTHEQRSDSLEQPLEHFKTVSFTI